LNKGSKKISKRFDERLGSDTVHERNPANQLRLVVYPIICKVYIFGVVQDFFHQQYEVTYGY